MHQTVSDQLRQDQYGAHHQQSSWPVQNQCRPPLKDRPRSPLQAKGFSCPMRARKAASCRERCRWDRVHLPEFLPRQAREPAQAPRSSSLRRPLFFRVTDQRQTSRARRLAQNARGWRDAHRGQTLIRHAPLVRNH